MVYIIIKTYKNLESKLMSVHETKEDASYHLNKLIEPKLINRIVSDNLLKIYENNYIFRNNSIYLYQIIEVIEGGEDKIELNLPD